MSELSLSLEIPTTISVPPPASLLLQEQMVEEEATSVDSSSPPVTKTITTVSDLPNDEKQASSLSLDESQAETIATPGELSKHELEQEQEHDQQGEEEKQADITATLTVDDSQPETITEEVSTETPQQPLTEAVEVEVGAETHEPTVEATPIPLLLEDEGDALFGSSTTATVNNSNSVFNTDFTTSSKLFDDDEELIFSAPPTTTTIPKTSKTEIPSAIPTTSSKVTTAAASKASSNSAKLFDDLFGQIETPDLSFDDSTSTTPPAKVEPQTAAVVAPTTSKEASVSSLSVSELTNNLTQSSQVNDYYTLLDIDLR